MDSISPSDLKTILHSKRANMYYLEWCRILVNSGRVEYVTDEGKQQRYWNIPIANTTVLLLGSGTSITQAAMRELSKAGVMVGFCGGGGTPLFCGTETEIAAQWFSPQSNYRPTEYVQRWMRFWFCDDKRLLAAKRIQQSRITCIQKEWQGHWLRESELKIDVTRLEKLLKRASARIESAGDLNALLLDEARVTKSLFKLAAEASDYGEFSRVKRGGGIDPANRFLDYGNYLAYGLGAAATWVLGLPHGLSVLHGKTRRGGLVFDAADLVKDAFVLPQAFLSAIEGHESREFRQACIERLTDGGALDLMIGTLQEIAAELGAPE